MLPNLFRSVDRVSTGITVPVSIRKFTGNFFPFHYGKGSGRSGIPFGFSDLSGMCPGKFRNAPRKPENFRNAFRKPENCYAREHPQTSIHRCTVALDKLVSSKPPCLVSSNSPCPVSSNSPCPCQLSW